MAKTILILAANPKNTPRLRLDQEVREIDNGLQRAQRRDEFILKQVWAVRRSDFRRAMLDFKPNIVHFCGHGSGEEGIAFEDENGLAKFMSAKALSGFFELFSDTVECVVLNACYSEVQAKAIAEHIPYVIGMHKAIGDTAAIEFSVAFYDALGAGKSIEFAYKLACNAIQLAGLPEQLTPILLKKSTSMCIAGDSQTLGSPLNIMVTGGRNTEPELLQIAFLIGQYVILRGHTLINNGSEGVDKASAEGALAACKLKNLDASAKIQVFRPRNAPKPHFDFGNLQIVGLDYDERRNFVIQKSDALILVGGYVGTRNIARQAQIVSKPIIPIGIGRNDETAVQLWHKIRNGSIDNLPVIPIQDRDLQQIGPEQKDMERIALSSVLIAERLVQNRPKRQ
jgi:predicted Rossmann-fold nucleotide-binding protein